MTEILARSATGSPLALLFDIVTTAQLTARLAQDEELDVAETAAADHIYAAYPDTLGLVVDHDAWAGSTVIMVDADRVKEINDGLGHAAGDAVLAAFGARLIAWAGPRAAVGRLGGDEPLTELTQSFWLVRWPFC